MLDDLDAPSAMTAEAVRRRAMDDTGEPPERAELEARLPKCEACGHVQPEIERQVKWEVAAAERMGAAAGVAASEARVRELREVAAQVLVVLGSVEWYAGCASEPCPACDPSGEGVEIGGEIQQRAREVKAQLSAALAALLSEEAS